MKEIVDEKEILKEEDKDGNNKNDKPIKIKVENKPLDYKNSDEIEDDNAKSVSAKDS